MTEKRWTEEKVLENEGSAGSKPSQDFFFNSPMIDISVFLVETRSVLAGSAGLEFSELQRKLSLNIQSKRHIRKLVVQLQR